MSDADLNLPPDLPSEEVFLPALPPPLPPALPEVSTPSPGKEPTFRDFFIALAIIWVIGFFVQVAGVIAMMAKTGFSNPGGFQPTGNFVLVMGIVDWAIALPVIAYFGAFRYGKTVWEGFRLVRVPARDLLTSFAIGIGGAIAAIAIMSYVGSGGAPVEQMAVEKSADGTYHLNLAFAVFGVLVPPLEELYYRGFMFPIFRRKFGVTIALATVAGWFGLLHAPQLFGDWAGLAIVVTMGVIWTIQRQRYDNLTPSVITHWTYNVILLGTQWVALECFSQT